MEDEGGAHGGYHGGGYHDSAYGFHIDGIILVAVSWWGSFMGSTCFMIL